VAPTGGYEPEVVEPAEPPKDDGKSPTTAQLNISPDIQKACGISSSDAYFAFDSANVRPQDRKILAKLATCFSTGPLAGEQMRLVGHADPRGESEYNMVLGENRASNVKKAIAAEGLDSNKMSTTSRGEMDATGTDEATWARDRRVDIMIAR
jgi:peptidoglycan-associated lipoprotein